MSVDFFDSNVLVYLFDETAPTKQAMAKGLVVKALTARTGCISFQVVQETLNVITRKIADPLPPEDARRFLDTVLLPLWRVMPTRDIYGSALDVQARYGYRFYDSLILAAAISAGATRLFSEDMQDGQRIQGLTITNPFVEG